ncbi:hypothetical protein K474DRAFT_1597780, partial [Panus rudis PR-1116 ss-1]
MFFPTLYALILLPYAFAAPTQSLDSATLLQNGQDAQTLNSEFQSLTVKDACDAGQMACVQNSRATCEFGSWKLQRCKDSEKCFAVPSLKDRGTSLLCTSEAHALSIIQASGVKGG